MEGERVTQVVKQSHYNLLKKLAIPSVIPLVLPF